MRVTLFVLSLFVGPFLSGCSGAEEEEEHEDPCAACDDATLDSCETALEACDALEGDEHETCEEDAEALCE
jgi:hypothetical protein